MTAETSLCAGKSWPERLPRLAVLVCGGCFLLVGFGSPSPMEARERDTMKTPIQVAQPLWCEELPESPKLEETRDEVEFNVVPGHNDRGPTKVLVAKYFLGQPLLAYYGGQLPKPIHVVAINQATGTVHHRECLQRKSPPVWVMTPEGEEPSSSGQSQSACFNIDLCAHLRLPREAASYHVFLWIDHVVSSMHVVDVAENSQRTDTLQSARKRTDLVTFRNVSPVAADLETIILQAGTSSERRHVHGTWGPDPNRTASRTAPYFLVLMAFNHRNRSFGWTSVDINALPENTVAGHFHLDVTELAGERQTEQKAFVLAFSAGRLSEVLVMGQ